LRTDGTDISLRASGSIYALLTLRTLYAVVTLRANVTLRSLRASGTDIPLRTSGTFWTLRALNPLLPLCPRGAVYALRPLWTLRTLNVSDVFPCCSGPYPKIALNQIAVTRTTLRRKFGRIIEFC
jgi:hypothetical protein